MFRSLAKNQIFKRFSGDYVLAQRVNGKLQIADFAREDKNFCFDPKVSADGKLTLSQIWQKLNLRHLQPISNMTEIKRGFIGPLVCFCIT